MSCLTRKPWDHVHPRAASTLTLRSASPTKKPRLEAGVFFVVRRRTGKLAINPDGPIALAPWSRWRQSRPRACVPAPARQRGALATKASLLSFDAGFGNLLFQARHFLAQADFFGRHVHFHKQADAGFAHHRHGGRLRRGLPCSFVANTLTSLSLANACSTAADDCRKAPSALSGPPHTAAGGYGGRHVHLTAQVAAGVHQLLELGDVRNGGFVNALGLADGVGRNRDTRDRYGDLRRAPPFATALQ